MGRIVVSVLTTVDGVAEDPLGSEGTEHGGWARDFDFGEECERYKLDEMMRAEALLLGRVTYEGLVGFWADRDDGSALAAKIQAMPKFVVSSTLEEAGWGDATVLRGNVVEQVGMLKAAFEGDILVPGGLRLVHTLFAEDLLDELRLLLLGRVAGGGRQLFPSDTESKPMRLARRGNFDSGIGYLVFEPRENANAV